MNFIEKISKIKQQLWISNQEGTNKKKQIENLMILGIIIVITVIVMNYILEDKGQNEDYSQNVGVLAQKNEILNESDEITLEKQLEDILKTIKGVGNVKVLITYSQTSQVLPMYSEDSTEKVTEENDSRWWN